MEKLSNKFTCTIFVFFLLSLVFALTTTCEASSYTLLAQRKVSIDMNMRIISLYQSSAKEQYYLVATSTSMLKNVHNIKKENNCKKNNYTNDMFSPSISGNYGL